MAGLYENKRIGQATHNMYAYRIYIKDRNSWEEGSRDDGEKHGGECIPKVLKVRCREILTSGFLCGSSFLVETMAVTNTRP